MPFYHSVGSCGFAFADLRTLMARASPLRSGDELAGTAAANARERVAAQMALADVPLSVFLNEAVVPNVWQQQTPCRFQAVNCTFAWSCS